MICGVSMITKLVFLFDLLLLLKSQPMSGISPRKMRRQSKTCSVSASKVLPWLAAEGAPNAGAHVPSASTNRLAGLRGSTRHCQDSTRKRRKQRRKGRRGPGVRGSQTSFTRLWEFLAFPCVSLRLSRPCVGCWQLAVRARAAPPVGTLAGPCSTLKRGRRQPSHAGALALRISGSRRFEPERCATFACAAPAFCSEPLCPVSGAHVNG